MVFLHSWGWCWGSERWRVLGGAGWGRPKPRPEFWPMTRLQLSKHGGGGRVSSSWLAGPWPGRAVEGRTQGWSLPSQQPLTCSGAALPKSFVFHSLLFLSLPFCFTILPPHKRWAFPSAYFWISLRIMSFPWLPSWHWHQLQLIRRAGETSLVPGGQEEPGSWQLAQVGTRGVSAVGAMRGVPTEQGARLWPTPAPHQRCERPSASGGDQSPQPLTVQRRTVHFLPGSCFLQTKPPHPGSTSKAGP